MTCPNCANKIVAIWATKHETITNNITKQTARGRCWYCGKVWEAERVITYSPYVILKEIEIEDE